MRYIKFLMITAFSILTTGTTYAQNAGDIVGSAPGLNVAHIGTTVRLGDNQANYIRSLASDSTNYSLNASYSGFQAEGSDPTINLYLIPKAGGVVFRNPQGTPTTGLPPGPGSVDLQTTVSQYVQGVTGTNSFAAGFSNTVTGNLSFVMGYNDVSGGAQGSYIFCYSCTSTGQYSQLFGQNGTDHHRFAIETHSLNMFATQGDSDYGHVIFKTQGTISDTAAHVMTNDGTTLNAAGYNAFNLDTVAPVHELTDCNSLFYNTATGTSEIQNIPFIRIDASIPTTTINMYSAASPGTSVTTVPFVAESPASPVVSISMFSDTSTHSVYPKATAASGSWRGQVTCEFQDN